jgi:glycogen debranching enzyme
VEVDVTEVEDVISVAGRYYILATSSPLDDRMHVLKEGETFAIFDRRGDIRPLGTSTQGLYFYDTRYLSRCSLLLEGFRPLVLSSQVSGAGALLTVDLTNTDIAQEDRVVIPHGALHISRTILVRDGKMRQRFRLASFSPVDVEVTLALDIDADYGDVFEVRGHRRSKRGRYAPPHIGRGNVVLGYTGLDGVERQTKITTSPPADVAASRISFRVKVPAGATKSLHVTFACEESAHEHRPKSRSLMLKNACRVSSTTASLDAWLSRSHDDLRMMLTTTQQGPYPSAGVPWYATTFGRDGIVTALQTLWLDSSVAKGVLGYLAATQATTMDPSKDAEPGKVIHEVRADEMANTNEVPFGRYYGSVDATPLFVLLAGEYLASTGDVARVAELWPNIEAALDWIPQYGDLDGDGFVEYRASEHALTNQGWKDSQDAIFFEDGSLASGPIALCEVQGYVYAAHRAGAEVARRLGHTARALDEDRAADVLREKFDRAFWIPERGTFALALDGRKRPCRVRTSNAGHCLWSGIALPERAPHVASALLDERGFSGWGVRTVAAGESRYNPMSYHNGTIWPHDNAIIAQGFARCGRKRDAVKLFGAMLDATRVVDLQRLPELFCGFSRVKGKAPTQYPVACSPQAWSAGAVYMFLQACLGLRIDAFRRRVWLDYPHLPPVVRELDIQGLRVGANASVDLALHRYPDGVGVDVRARVGDVDVCMLK